MSEDQSSPPYDYVVFIDEAGDPGLKSVRPIDPNGASEWMTIGAALIRATDEGNTVQWIKDIRQQIRRHDGPDLHYRRLSDAKKIIVAKYISNLGPTRLAGFAVMSHKPNMQGWKNPRAERVNNDRGWFYNWCIRLILERITDAVYRHSFKIHGEAKFLKIVFSERGGIKYEWMKQYIERLIQQAEVGNTHLSKRIIKREVLHHNLIEIIPNNQSAGCQLADAITSAFHCAADASGNRWTTHPAELLRPIMPKENTFHFDYSVVIQPEAWRSTELLNPAQKKIFKFYQYNI